MWSFRRIPRVVDRRLTSPEYYNPEPITIYLDTITDADADADAVNRHPIRPIRTGCISPTPEPDPHASAPAGSSRHLLTTRLDSRLVTDSPRTCQHISHGISTIHDQSERIPRHSCMSTSRATRDIALPGYTLYEYTITILPRDHSQPIGREVARCFPRIHLTRP